ncbi:MAG: NAD-dependent epimerase/dehydratase family protein [Erysipelotrichaceae bacterium]|nr:NAD-dependent epimerase/dehydratase family protein [Erysipelotrichaceae bacterium]
MEKIYLVTGASGHLGSTLVRFLKKDGFRIIALTLPGEEAYVDKDIEICQGNVNDMESLERFFAYTKGKKAILFHCAGIVSISSKENPLLNKVNIEGTENILKMALKHGIKKMIYVSSVHAILEEEEGITCEPQQFYPEKIGDPYGRSKACGTLLCLDYAKKGLDVSIVHPAGIYGPGDYRKNNHAVNSVRVLSKFPTPVGVEGGFDFVDVRDVAQGMIDCAGKGRKGECYILAGHYLSVMDLINSINEICGRRKISLCLPYRIVRPFTPLMEKVISLFSPKPLITPYSLAVLNTNGHFSHEKACREFDYRTRDAKDSIRDMIDEFTK